MKMALKYFKNLLIESIKSTVGIMFLLVLSYMIENTTTVITDFVLHIIGFILIIFVGLTSIGALLGFNFFKEMRGRD